MEITERVNKSLMLAIQLGNLKAAQRAVQEGADINLKGINGQTPLMRAVLNKREDIFSWLLSLNVDVNASDKEGKTALMLAYQEGLKGFAHELEARGADQNMRDMNGNKAKDYEMEESVCEAYPVKEESKNEEVAKVEAKQEEIKKEQAEKEELQKQEQKKEEEQKAQEEKEQKEESKNEEKSPVLEVMNTVLALKQAHEVLEIASKTGIKIKEGEEVQLTSTLAAQMMRMAKQKALNEKEETALIQTAGVLLYLAGYQNKADVARQVFAYYKDFYKHSQYLAEGIFVAAGLGHRDVVNEMIIHGADLNPKTGKRPLESAVSGGHEAVVNLLLSKGANVLPLDLDIAGGKGYEKLIDVLWLKTKKDKKALRKALYSAASAGHVNVVEKILKETDKWGAMGYNQVFKPIQTYTSSFATTALFGAVRNNHMALAKMLLEKGADAKQDAILYPAVHHKNKELTQILLEKGADMHMPFESKLGKIEPVAEAIRNNDVEIVQLFLEKGLNPNKKVYTIGNEMHQLKEIYCSLLMLSAQSGAVDVMNVLIEKGAHINEVNKNKESVLDVFEKNNLFEISNNKKMKEYVDYLRNLGAKTAKEIQEERREKSFMTRLKKALSRN